jgi:hypothetical protein
MNDARKRGQRTLILISLIFAMPIFIAMYMYFSEDTWQSIGSTEHGQLITPSRLLPDAPLSEADPQRRLRKIWSLLVLANNECDSTCLETLEHIRQIRLSLGPKMTRLQTVFLPADEGAIRGEFDNEHPVLIVVDPNISAEIRTIIGGYENGEIFLADPLGNLMMHYPPGTSMSDMREDITHLLKLSGIG